VDKGVTFLGDNMSRYFSHRKKLRENSIHVYNSSTVLLLVVVLLPARHLNTSKSVFKRGELLLNTFVFFHIAEKVLSFSSLSPAFVFCLILLSFLAFAK
jgi:hypothetical protein